MPTAVRSAAGAAKLVPSMRRNRPGFAGSLTRKGCSAPPPNASTSGLMTPGRRPGPRPLYGARRHADGSDEAPTARAFTESAGTWIRALPDCRSRYPSLPTATVAALVRRAAAPSPARSAHGRHRAPRPGPPSSGVDPPDDRSRPNSPADPQPESTDRRSSWASFLSYSPSFSPSSGGDEDHPEPVNPAGWGTHRKCLPICTGSRLCSQLFAQVRESPGGPPALEPNPHRWIQAQPARGRSPRVRATPAARLACWYLHRLVLVLAPVIMTGTVHRPMELVLPSAALPGHRPRRPDTGSVAGTVTGSVGRTVAGERRNGSFCADRQGGHVHRGRRDGGGAERRCWFWGSRALRTSAGARSLLMAG